MQKQAQQDTHSSKNGEGKGQLGPWLCWAVVFADIGTSIYYVPGILYHTVNALSGFFVFLTMIVFILLTFKYVEVTYRFPQGGGVVTVAARALNRWFGALGGMFILVDYFLTAAISSLSGILYWSVVLPAIGTMHFIGFPLTVWATIFVLILLGILNWIGISESAKVSMVAAIIAFISDIAILVTVFTHLSFPQFLALFPQMFSTHTLTPITLLVGFAGSFLAFSGLESISQLSPVMKLPRRHVGKIALFIVVLTIGVTSPLLTMLSTLLLPHAAANTVLSSQIISLLAGKWGGPFLQTEVAISAGALLIFASNTAIIGTYHVFLALSRMEFFPGWLTKLNKLRNTPHFSIALATLVPIAVLIAVRGDINILGDMYAFGLLGAFMLTCLSMDIVRYRARKIRARLSKTIDDSEQREKAVAAEETAMENEQQGSTLVESIKRTADASPTGETQGQADKEAQEEANKPITSEEPEPVGRWTRSTFNYVLGIITTALVLTAWVTNLIAKPLATLFGGSVAIIGMLIAYLYYRHEEKKGRIPVLTTGVESNFPAQVLAVLASNDPENEAVVNAALSVDEPRPVVFLYLGQKTDEQRKEPFRLTEAHLNDTAAKDLLGRVNAQANQKHVDCRFIYRYPGPHVVSNIWDSIHPEDTILSQKQADQLSHHHNGYKRVKPVQTTHNDQLVHLQKA